MLYRHVILYQLTNPLHEAESFLKSL